MKLLYNITTHVDLSVHEEWRQFMEEEYIPVMMGSGYFTSYKWLKILGDEQEDGISFAIQFVVEDLDTFLTYQNELMPSLSAKQKSLFEESCHSFKTLMEIVSD